MTLTPSQTAAVVDFGQVRHDRIKATGSRVVERINQQQTQAARQLADASAALAAALRAGHLYTSPVVNECERAVYRAALALAGQDTFQEWADCLGIVE